LVDQLPVASEDKDVLVAHPGMVVVAPALFLNRVPVVADATGAVLNALDHEHRFHLQSQGVAPLLPFTTRHGDEWLVDKLHVLLAVGPKQLVLKSINPTPRRLPRPLVFRP
jgi:hypothetical protein